MVLSTNHSIIYYSRLWLYTINTIFNVILRIDGTCKCTRFDRCNQYCWLIFWPYYVCIGALSRRALCRRALLIKFFFLKINSRQKWRSKIIGTTTKKSLFLTAQPMYNQFKGILLYLQKYLTLAAESTIIHKNNETTNFTEK